MSSNERRTFSRVTFDARTSISQGDSTWDVILIDLSLRGLLVEEPQNWHRNANQPFDAIIHLSDNSHITMRVLERHQNHHQIGFECLHIDINSIHHLRRLVELNIGDLGLLEREVAALGQ